MILDYNLLFSDAQALTVSAASTNYVDLGADRDLGTGADIYVGLCVDVALTDSSSNSTVSVYLQTDDNSSFSSATNGQLLFTIAATAAAGTTYYACISPGAADERYMRLYYSMNNGDLSTGSVTAFIVSDIQKYKAYQDNITIS